MAEYVTVVRVNEVPIDTGHTMENEGDLMVTVNSPLVRDTLAIMVFVLVLGALSMIWPGIMALFIGALLLLRACSAEQEIAVRSWTEIGNLSIAFAS